MAAQTSGSSLRTYIIRRLLLMVPTMLGVSVVVFVLCAFVPGGPIDQYRLRLAGADGAGESGGTRSRASAVDSNVSKEQIAKLEAYYGFDKPVPVQYWRYLKNVVRLDFGDSFRFSVPAIDLIKARLPVSIYYGLVTTVLTYLICIPLGMVKAINHHSYLDNASSVLIFVGYAIPGFALGTVMLSYMGLQWGWFPIGGFKSTDFTDLSTGKKAIDLVHHSVLPLICYMVGSFAFMTMLMKNSLMENMSADFVKTALANGLPWRRAIFVHAFRNSLVPLATSFGHNISLILTGSVLIERVFNIPGIGLLFFDSITARDYPVVMALTLIGAGLLMVGNLLSDMCVAAVDPRVRFA